MFKSLLAPFLLCGSVLAQSVSIMSPSEGQVVVPGDNVTVQVAYANSLTGSQQVSLVISYQACFKVNCSIPADQTLGSTLYMGPYSPQYHEPYNPPYENFTVTIPNTDGSGRSQINLAHFYLLGASASPILEFKNVSVTTADQNEAPARRKVAFGRSYD